MSGDVTATIATGDDGAVKRRGLLQLGALATAISGTSALGFGASGAQAADLSAVPTQVDPSPIYATVVNAKSPEYGIIGDGVTDDTAAIQAMLADIGPNTAVHFSAGTYKHTNIVITAKSNFSLIGDGAVFVATTRSEPYLRFVNCTDVTVRGITSKGAIATTRQGPTRGISFENCKSYFITGCHIHNTEGVGIYSGNGCHDGRIVGNLVHDTLADGIHATGTCRRIVITGNTVRDTGDDAIAVVSYGSDSNGPCEDITIAGNLSWHSNSRGLVVSGGKNIAVSGNTIRDTKNAGIYIAYENTYPTRAVEDVSIVGNTVLGANTYNTPTNKCAGVQVVGNGGRSTPVSGITISGNTVEGSGWHGILIGNVGVGCYGVIVNDNNVRKSGEHAIMVQAAQDVLICGNMIDTAAEAGIYCNDTRGLLSISSNVIREPNRSSVATSRRGIIAAAPRLIRGVISGNLVFDSTFNTNHPLDLSTAVNISVYGNAVGGNMTNYPGVTGLPFIAPGSSLLCGAFETSGLGSGVGVIGVRNAGAPPTTNPSSGGILFAEFGAARWRTPKGTVSTIAGDVTSVSQNYTALLSDRTILATAGARSITVTLPPAARGLRFEVKKCDSGAGSVVVAASLSQTIDGAVTRTLVRQFATISVVSNGTSWSVI